MKCVLGKISVDNVTMDEAVSVIARMANKSDCARLVCTANLDHLAAVHKDPQFMAVYDDADFVVADGMPLIWLSRIIGTKLKERVAGSDLLWELARTSSSTGVRLFFLGGRPGAAEASAVQIKSKYSDAQIVGTYCPPVGTIDNPEELSQIKSAIAEAKPNVLLVGFGSPKQEKWIASYRQMMRVPVSIGVGASFDMAAGVVQRAPMWMRNCGLEWLFRLQQEPKRLFKRYFGTDMPFLGWLFVRLLFGRLASAVSAKPQGPQL